MKLKFIAIVLLALLLFTSAGCSGTWRKKFVRTKKGEAAEGPVLQPYDYKREFTNNQLYANNYAFWRASQSELISSVKLKDNPRKLDSQSGYAFVHLKKLSTLLIDEKKTELEPYISELEDMIDKIQQPNYVSSNSNILASRLTKHYKAVSREFSYHRMKSFIRPDEHDNTESD
jgi:hypothetical protein